MIAVTNALAQMGGLDHMDLIVVTAVFGLVLTLWFIGLLAWSIRRAMRVRKVEARLGIEEEDDSGAKRTLRLWHDGQEATTTVPWRSSRGKMRRRFEALFRDAGWEAPLLTIFVGLTGAAVLALVLGTLMSGSWLAGLITAVAAVMLFWVYVKLRRDKRTTRFEKQFADSLGMVARSLRAGHPLMGGFQLAAEQMASPISDIYTEICQQQSLGVGLEEALQRVATKYNSGDLKLFATSVTIQLRSGGNLADMMDRLAFVIRERLRLGRRVRVLTAQTQFSKRVLIVLPFVVFAIINFLSPHYMTALYTSSLGKVMLAIGAVSLLVGIWAMNRIAVLKY